jgi:hypothetical protein
MEIEGNNSVSYLLVGFPVCGVETYVIRDSFTPVSLTFQRILTFKSSRLVSRNLGIKTKEKTILSCVCTTLEPLRRQRNVY